MQQVPHSYRSAAAAAFSSWDYMALSTCFYQSTSGDNVPIDGARVVSVFSMLVINIIDTP